MSVLINQLQDDQVLVNGKLVYQDSAGNWVAKEELTTGESRAFREHINSVSKSA